MNLRLLDLMIWSLLVVGSMIYLVAVSSAQGLEQSSNTAPSSVQRLTVADVTVVRPLVEAARMQAPQAAIPMNENFENPWPVTNSGWLIEDKSNPANDYLWGRQDCHPYNGLYAAWSTGIGNKGGQLHCGDQYPNNLDTWAIYGPFDLSQATSASLTFYFWGSTEVQPNCTADRMYVASSIDGQQFSKGQYFCGYWEGGPETNGYFKFTLDLNSRLGQSQVYIGFEFQTNSSVTDVGMMIDDVKLDVAGNIPPTPTSPPLSFISGRVTNANNNPIEGVTISDNAGHTVITKSDGGYGLLDLLPGTYVLTASRAGYTFSPASQTVAVPPNSPGLNFIDTLPTPTPTATASPTPRPIAAVAVSDFTLTDAAFLGYPDKNAVLNVKTCQAKEVHIQLTNNGQTNFAGGQYTVQWVVRKNGNDVEKGVVPHIITDALPAIVAGGQANDVRIAAFGFFKIVQDGELFITLIPDSVLTPPFPQNPDPIKITIEREFDVIDCLNEYTLQILRLIAQGVFDPAKWASQFVTTGSPVYPLVTNSQGQRAGFLANGEITEEIPGSHVVAIGEKRIVIYPGLDAVQVQVVGYAKGSMTLATGFVHSDGTGTLVTHENAPVSQGMLATLNSIDTTFMLAYDFEADGHIDVYREPDRIETVLPFVHIYLPLIMENNKFCGQFVWFRQGIDRYPGFQLANSSELWFFDEVGLGKLPAEGSYAIIRNPQFMPEEFSPGIRWLMGAASITPISSCQP